jgi:GLPGLI family protein
LLRNLLIKLARLYIVSINKMKKNLYIALLSLLIFSASATAQKKLTEATISYDIVINTSNTTPQAADLLDGATSVIYLKGNSSRSEMVSSLGTQATVIDGKSGDVTILKDYGEQRYMIKMTPVNWKESNKKYDGITFTYYDEYKMIAGYNCQKAVGRLSDSSTFTVYFTKDLVPVNKDFQYLNRNLPGLAMQYEASLGKLLVTYTVANINFNPVPQAKFDLPKSGYRVMTYEESKGINRNR